MNKEVSFLLGSGFSVADGLPLVSDINKRLLSLNENDIFINSDMRIVILDKQDQQLFRLKWTDERFFVRFIKFYSTEVISNPNNFNYEDLFDYCTAFSNYGKHKDQIKEFCAKFRDELRPYEGFTDDDHNLIYRFEMYLNRILALFLQVPRYYEDVSLGNYPKYDSFANFIGTLLEKHIVKVHTLNHDMLFEHIASKIDSLWEHYCDGFKDNNSPFYGEVNISHNIYKTYKVRLKQYIDIFDKNLCFYKLHGSIDTYIADITDPHQIRVKMDYGVSAVLKEIINTEGVHEYQFLLQHVYPDFLSGTTSKIVKYGSPYFKTIIEKFENNLLTSNLLYVIGYGFKDEGINNILIKNYLGHGKKMIVISPHIPTSNLISNFNIEIINKPFVDVTYEDYIKASDSFLN